jgi:hypothetical protein
MNLYRTRLIFFRPKRFHQIGPSTRRRTAAQKVGHFNLESNTMGREIESRHCIPRVISKKVEIRK